MISQYHIIKDTIFDVINAFYKGLYFISIITTKVYNIMLYIIQKKIKKIVLQSLQILSNCMFNLKQKSTI